MEPDARQEIGGTGLAVTALGLGGAPLGNLLAEVGEDAAEGAIDAAYDAGIRLFDTAPLYGHGLSEHRMGRALRHAPRGDYVLSTKVGRLLKPQAPDRVDGKEFRNPLPFEVVYDYSYDGVMRSFEDSLQRLGLSRIDMLLIHDVDVWTHGTKEASDGRIAEVMEGGYRAMAKLRAEGTIKAIGAGLNEWQPCQRLAELGDFDCFLLAGRYTLLEQDALESFLPLCQARGISIVIGGPFNTGILATGAVEGAYYDYAPPPPPVMERVARIEAVCGRHDVPLAAAALQFPLGHSAVAAVIPGARSADEVMRSVALFSAPIPADLWQELRAEGLLRADAPAPGPAAPACP